MAVRDRLDRLPVRVVADHRHCRVADIRSGGLQLFTSKCSDRCRSQADLIYTKRIHVRVYRKKLFFLFHTYFTSRIDIFHFQDAFLFI